MSRTQIDVSIDIIREVDFSPRKRRELAAAFGGGRHLGKYLDTLAQTGYIAANRDGLYECTQRGRQALDAYDRLLERGLVTEQDSILYTDLVMLRELGDGNYKVALTGRSRLRIKQRLIKRGFVVEGGLTAEGREVLVLTTKLFELGNSLHFYPETPE